MSKVGLASIFNARRGKGRDLPIERPAKAQGPVDTAGLGREQRELFDIMENTDKSLFVTGKAGTGKSYLLNFFVANSQKAIAVVAPTGVAAINVRGQTIHSFFRIPTKTPFSKEDLRPTPSQELLYQELDAIVIDEVSMVRADVMDAIDHILKSANKSDRPFGGKQMLMFGDLYQLPPIADPQEKRFLDDMFGGTFFFHAPAIRVGLEIHELTHVFRQKDPCFIEILNQVREGDISDASLRRLNQRAIDMDEDPAVVIAPTRQAVDLINSTTLNNDDECEGPVFSYEAAIDGNIKETEFPTQKTLKLRVGARVMMLKNDSGTSSNRPQENHRWVNGTLAQISRLSKDAIWVMVNGVSHRLDRFTWQKIRYAYDEKKKKLNSRVTASFTQFPITLAWAITVHKAQGATYQSVGVDMASGMFAHGQTYVALSRCVDMNRLYLSRPVSRTDILTSEEVKAFMHDTSQPLSSA